MSGQQYDDPNRQAVGLDPAWVEGSGGEGEGTPPLEPQPEPQPEPPPAEEEPA